MISFKTIAELSWQDNEKKRDGCHERAFHDSRLFIICNKSNGLFLILNIPDYLNRSSGSTIFQTRIVGKFPFIYHFKLRMKQEAMRSD